MNALREPRTGQFRPMLFADLREITLIERRAYEFCWTDGIFRDCIRTVSGRWRSAHSQPVHTGGITGARVGATSIRSPARPGLFRPDPDGISGGSPLQPPRRAALQCCGVLRDWAANWLLPGGQG